MSKRKYGINALIISPVRPNYDWTPKRGVARIVGVAWEARQSNFAYVYFLSNREQAQPDMRYPGRKVVMATIWSAASASWVKQWARLARSKMRASGLVCSGWLSR